MEQLNRSELRVKIMTILYQISIYEKNKIDYKLDDIFKEVLEIIALPSVLGCGACKKNISN